MAETDLISRQAAIDALNGEINITGRANAEAVRGYVRLVKDRLERLPSAQPKERTEERAETHACDLIDRQAAIDAVNNLTYPSSLVDVKRILVDLPSTQPDPRWIPCSERPPEKDGRYQVTRHDDVTNTEFIDILWYEKNLWWDRHSAGDYAVTAWMPLPEPYKEGADK